MMISDFARRAGLSVDTVRFYIRLGLLRPQTGRKGGSNPYQIFDAEQIQSARVIRLMQGLGFSLKEIARIAQEYHRGDMTPARAREIMAGQLAELEAKQADLAIMVAYTRAKVAWLDNGGIGPEPDLDGFGACGTGDARTLESAAA